MAKLRFVKKWLTFGSPWVIITPSTQTKLDFEMIKSRIITIKLMPSVLMRDIYFINDKESFVRQHLDQYEITPSFEFICDDKDPAEEVWDMINNPRRQGTREELYGNGRSVSVGDVVNVDGKDYLCNTIGFIELWERDRNSIEARIIELEHTISDLESEIEFKTLCLNAFQRDLRKLILENEDDTRDCG